MKKKYDSFIIFLYASGNEEILPPHFRKQIPYTTISSWRKTDYSKFIGSEFRFLFTEAQRSAEINKKLTTANKSLAAISKPG